MFDLQGSLVALVTPMDAHGGVDFDALRRLLDKHMAAGTHGVVAVGTTGESPTLSFEEHCAVIRTTAEHCRDQIKVVAGTGANATHEATELTLAAEAAGVDAALLVTPYYNKPTQEGLFLHYQAIAAASSLPLILYNVPGRTACDLAVETVQRLAVLPTVVGIKEASGRPERCQQLVESLPGFRVYSGDDDLTLEVFRRGGHGVISVTANVVPERMAAFCQAAMDKDWQRAEALDADLQELHRVMFVESNPIPAKWALQRMGWIECGIRLPLTPPSQEHQYEIEKVLKNKGVL